MPYQNSLWGVQTREIGNPIVHKNDPETAHKAAEKVTNSGARKSNNQRVAWLVARYPGLTASEYTQQFIAANSIFRGESFDKMLIEVRRRLSDMNGSHVRRGTKEEARMGLLKNKESVWWPK